MLLKLQYAIYLNFTSVLNIVYSSVTFSAKYCLILYVIFVCSPPSHTQIACRQTRCPSTSFSSNMKRNFHYLYSIGNSYQRVPHHCSSNIEFSYLYHSFSACQVKIGICFTNYYNVGLFLVRGHFHFPEVILRLNQYALYKRA